MLLEIGNSDPERDRCDYPDIDMVAEPGVKPTFTATDRPIRSTLARRGARPAVPGVIPGAAPGRRRRRQPHGLPIEADEFLRPKPGPFLGDDAVGEVPPAARVARPAAAAGRLTATLSALIRRRTARPASGRAKPYPCPSTQTSSHRAGTARATTSASANTAWASRACQASSSVIALQEVRVGGDPQGRPAQPRAATALISSIESALPSAGFNSPNTSRDPARRGRGPEFDAPVGKQVDVDLLTRPHAQSVRAIPCAGSPGPWR